jgi:hypothetical protein
MANACRSHPSCQFYPVSPICNERAPSASVPEAHLSVDLPCQHYKTMKIVRIPFDPRLSAHGKFNTLHEAMLFVGKHCLVHHKMFTRNLARMYIAFCRVLDFAKGGYVVFARLSKKEFDQEFTKVARTLGAGQ